MHSSVYINTLRISASILNKLNGFFIATAHIDLKGAVILKLTLL